MKMTPFRSDPLLFNSIHVNRHINISAMRRCVYNDDDDDGSGCVCIQVVSLSLGAFISSNQAHNFIQKKQNVKHIYIDTR